MTIRRMIRGAAAVVLVLAMLPTPSDAKDYFLAIGGGYAPAGNQASLEKNVVMFQTLVAEAYGEQAHVDVLYSDGRAPERDLQFKDPSFQVPKANLYLARLYGQENGLYNQYRNNAIPEITDEASRSTVQAWFDRAANTLHSGDRLFVYVTTHGGRSKDKNKQHDTSFYVWNREEFRVAEFDDLLDKLPEGVDVVLVMVQCYAGGFSHSVFQDGDADKGPTAANRCGFFATVQDRPAAGCTPDIDEANYQEYSSFFWSALRGVNRAGETINAPDYDKDGRVSFAEAHAYALLVSDTIDISIKTSDAFLRAYSKTKRNDSKKGKKNEADGGQDEKTELMTADSPWEALLEKAAPYQSAVLDGLSRELNLAGDQRGKAAREMAGKTDKEKGQIDQQRKKKRGELDKIRKDMRMAIERHWPELYNRWSPRVTRLLVEEAEAIERSFEAHNEFSKFMQLHSELETLDDEKLELTRRWTKCQRLLRVMENVALAANLPQVGTPQLQARFEALVAAEQGFFGPVPGSGLTDETVQTISTP